MSEILIIALLLLNILDGFMTYRAVEYGGKIERNPLAAYLFRKLSVRFGLVLMKGAAVVAILVLPLHLYVLAGLTVFYVGITINNVIQARQ